MKKILFLIIINCFIIKVGFAQNDAKLYQKYLDQAEQFYQKKDFLTALERFDLALGFAQTETQKNLVNERQNQCREKIKAQKSEIDVNLNKAIKSESETKKALEAMDLEKQKVIKQKERGDSAINANILNFYAFNSKDFALKSRQFTSNRPMEALYSIYSYKMINFGNLKYGKYGRIRPDNTVKESLIETYLNNFGIIVDSIGSYHINTYKNNILQCFNSYGYTKIKLSKIKMDMYTQQTSFLDGNEFVLNGSDLVTNSVFVSDSQFVVATSKGAIYINNEEHLEKLYNCDTRINDLKFDAETNSIIFATIDQKIIQYNLNLGTKIIVKTPDFVYNLNIVDSTVIIYNSLHKLHAIHNMDAKSDTVIYNANENYITKTDYSKQNSLLFAGIKNQIHIFDFQNTVKYITYKEEIINAEHKGNINYLYFDNHGHKLISSDWTGKIMTWDFSDITENRIYTQPMILDTNKKNFSFSFNNILNTLFFVDQKKTSCISYSTDLLYNALLKKHNNPKMSQIDWENNIKGDVLLPEENIDN